MRYGIMVPTELTVSNAHITSAQNEFDYDKYLSHESLGYKQFLSEFAKTRRHVLTRLRNYQTATYANVGRIHMITKLI